MKDDIHVRVDSDITAGVREFASRHGISLAAAVSLLLRRALSEEVQP